MLTVMSLAACGEGIREGNELSRKQIRQIENLGILDEGEEIVLFHSQANGSDAVEKSGNFFTEKRIASYWFDEYHEERTYVKSAFYSEVDTIWRYPKYDSWTLASYLEVHQSNGEKFKVYVAGDSAEVWSFFNLALQTWFENKNQSELNNDPKD